MCPNAVGAIQRDRDLVALTCQVPKHLGDLRLVVDN